MIVDSFDSVDFVHETRIRSALSSELSDNKDEQPVVFMRERVQQPATPAAFGRGEQHSRSEYNSMIYAGRCWKRNSVTAKFWRRSVRAAWAKSIAPGTTGLGREVAVKLLPDELASDSERLRRFEQEARVAAGAEHPNILTIYRFGEKDGRTPYLITELLQGPTLRERLLTGPIPVRKTVDYALQTTRGLAAAHDRGIVPPRLETLRTSLLLGTAL